MVVVINKPEKDISLLVLIVAVFIGIHGTDSCSKNNIPASALLTNLMALYDI
jgi:hypothetical protein